ncbi:response regulator transcription factor [Guggenheimella bovis]
MAKILVIEDEKQIARFVQLELEHEKHQVTLCHDGREGLEVALRDDFDLILLDIMLPSLSGMEILRRFRREKKTPIILVTAKDDVTDKVSGLDSGADDYLTKPFAIEELLARIRRLLRDQVAKNVLSYHGLTLDSNSYQVTYNDQEIELTRTEFDLLQYFLTNPEQVLTRDQIMNHVWGFDYLGDSNNVDVYVRYLRTKIDDTFGVKLIRTVRGVGYKLHEEN